MSCWTRWKRKIFRRRFPSTPRSVLKNATTARRSAWMVTKSKAAPRKPQKRKYYKKLKKKIYERHPCQTTNHDHQRGGNQRDSRRGAALRCCSRAGGSRQGTADGWLGRGRGRRADGNSGRNLARRNVRRRAVCEGRDLRQPAGAVRAALHRQPLQKRMFLLRLSRRQHRIETPHADAGRNRRRGENPD